MSKHAISAFVSLVSFQNSYCYNSDTSKMMHKSTHKYRKCSFCPHNQQKCCCQTNPHSLRRSNKNNSKNSKNKSKSIKNINESTISYINSTLPIANSAIPDFSTSIIAQNSILRTENDLLKKELSTQYQPSHQVSAFIKDFKDDKNMFTLPNSEQETSRTYRLHDKLYTSNRNLQQALFQLDSLSKMNKELHESNMKLQKEINKIMIQKEQIQLENQKIKKKMKKMNKTIESYPCQEELKRVYEDNYQLQKQKASLIEEIQELKLDLKRCSQRGAIEVENLSPQWVAHTSTKINAIQKNISKLEYENKQNMTPNMSLFVKKEQQGDLINLKKQIITTIKYLKLQSQSFKYGMSTFDQFMDSSNPSVMLLVKNLCQSLFEPLQNVYFEMSKALDRKFKQHENKFNKLILKLQNTLIKLKNSKLREQQFTTNF